MQEVSCTTAGGGAKVVAMAPTPLDRRTRFDVDLRSLSPDEFFTGALPPLIDRHGALVAYRDRRARRATAGPRGR